MGLKTISKIGKKKKVGYLYRDIRAHELEIEFFYHYGAPVIKNQF